MSDVTDELAALHTQIAHLDARLTERDGNLDERLGRIELSLLGDKPVGLDGMVDKVKALSNLAAETETVHASIRNEAKAGDRRLHERIDKIEKMMWVAVGAALASGGGAAYQWVFG